MPHMMSDFEKFWNSKVYWYAKELEESNDILNLWSSELTPWAAGAVHLEMFFFKPFSNCFS